jgi:hypothetical protein
MDEVYFVNQTISTEWLFNNGHYAGIQRGKIPQRVN